MFIFAGKEKGLEGSWDYDAALGVRISRDPIGEKGGLNLYGYVLNDPVNWGDPSGLYGYETKFCNAKQRDRQIGAPHKYLDPQSNAISQFDYDQNAVGNITSWTQAHGGPSVSNTYALGYDNADQLTSAVLSGSSATTSYHFDYDQAGNRVSQQVNDTATGATFNIVNEMTSRGSGGLTHFMGTVNKPSVVTIGSGTAQVDPLGHFDGKLALASGTNTVPITATDANGNTKTQNYTVVVSGTAAVSYSYDSNGNLIADGTRTYEWDAADRLIAINYAGTGNRTEFSYDPLGRRSRIVEKSGDTITSDKSFVWSGLSISEERDANNAVTRRFYPQGEQIDGQSYYYTRDHLGSIRELTDATGNVAARYDYDLWGNRSANQITGASAVESEFGYTGHYFHSPSTLYLAPFRAYDASIGRWISRDPIGEKGGLNLYGYVLNNPIRYVDPLGLFMNVENPLVNPGGPTASNMFDPGVASQLTPGEVLTPFATYGALAAAAYFAPEAAENLKLDGPQRGGRICQVRWGTTPLIRLEYGRWMTPSGPQDRLHLNIGPGKSNLHVPLDPRVWFDK